MQPFASHPCADLGIVRNEHWKKNKQKYNPPTPKKHPFPKIKSGTADNTPRVDRQG